MLPQRYGAGRTAMYPIRGIDEPGLLTEPGLGMPTMATMHRHRFTVDEYYRMAEAGILSHDARVELVDGEIIEMSPIGRLHASRTMYLNAVFSARLGGRSTVSVQNPVRLSSRSEPQPDLALLRPRSDFYASGHPGPGDTLLVIEIADSSLVTDRDVKTPLYARAGIPETWVLNLVADTLEVYRQPSADGYRDVRILRSGDTVSPEAFPDVVLSAADILGLTPD